MKPAGLIPPTPIALVLALLLPASGSGRMMPDAPIEDFRLPVFAENGYKSWELRGLRGHYRGEEKALVEGLELAVFSADEAMLREMLIRSPRADINFAATRAEGDSSLFVDGPNYEISGRNWTWFGEEEKIVVRESVRVSFAGAVNILD
ncbi:MAG: hypothetical protein GVY10_09180 [Verrucomicrobia bacterium]|jgi:hypothetical protein|nr:hypothetical protein [Verrucomicrobiota bacterium]